MKMKRNDDDGGEKKSPPASGSHWKRHWSSSSAVNQDVSKIRAVWLGRALVAVVLVVVASTLGIVAHLLLTHAERKLAETQFDSLSNRALVEAEEIAHRRRWAGVAMANFVSELYPSAGDWPTGMPLLGFERLVRAILNTSSGVDMGVIPILTPEQAPAFENFAYSVYEQLGFPNSTGYSSFGRGIWARNNTLGTSDNRYHDTGTQPSLYGSPYSVLAPVFRTDEGPHPILMFNVHSMKTQGEAIDRMITCSRNRKEAFHRGESILQESNCGVISDMFKIVKHNGRWGAMLARPIYPVNDPLELVGYVSTLFLVDELLENVFSDEVSGIDAVFESEGQSITFTIENGVTHLVGEGDHHDPKYDHRGQTVEMLDHSLYTEDSPTFRFSLYPNDDFSEVYETKNPITAALGSVLIILLTSLVFLLYDFFVRRAFHAKRELIEARRQFMRFVSHEVRTPLNSVYMGLELMQEELAQALGFESATCALACHEQGEIDKARNSNNESTETEERTFSHQKALEWFFLTKEIQGNTQGATDVLNDLLNYDKIEQGNLKLSLDVISVWSLIEKVAMEFKLPASSKKVHFDVLFLADKGSEYSQKDKEGTSRARDLPGYVRKLKVIGDSVRLTQVLRNLVSNALKFTPEGGAVRVTSVLAPDPTEEQPRTVSVREDESIAVFRRGSVRITVEDTGVGMSQDQLANLFSDGVQFNANELQAGGGSGLGLFIAKGIVELHNGKLAASSDGLTRGSTFSATLPLWELHEEDRRARNDMLRGKSETAMSSRSFHLITSKMRILVVDDAKSNRKLLRRLLENAGHACDEAENGKVAVEKCESAALVSRPYHCVLLDYEMPVLDGPSAAKELRQAGFDMYIIGITGNVLPQDVAYFKSSGADDVLSKPVKFADLDLLWMQNGTYEQHAESDP